MAWQSNASFQSDHEVTGTHKKKHIPQVMSMEHVGMYSTDGGIIRDTERPHCLSSHICANPKYMSSSRALFPGI